MVHKTSISPDKYAVLFAPDGKHFQKLKSGKIEKMWDYFNFNKDVREQMMLNPQAKFRLVNLVTNKMIGELPRK